MSQSILLIGNNGQVGKELETILAPDGNIITVARPSLDLTQPDILRSVIALNQPQIIINAAAYTAVDKAESEAELAKIINATAPLILAEESQKLGAFLIHISTDYVFDGLSCSPYQESSATNPLSVYGKTKLAGEEAIRHTCNNYLILRTAWVYGRYAKVTLSKRCCDWVQKKKKSALLPIKLVVPLGQKI